MKLEVLSLITIMCGLFAAICLTITIGEHIINDVFVWELGVLSIFLTIAAYSLWKFIVLMNKNYGKD